MPAYSLPPLSPPSIPYSRAGSPSLQQDSSDAVVTGVELMISGLNRLSIQSAHSHFGAFVSQYNNANPNHPLPPLQVHVGDLRNPVDYVFVALRPDVSSEPRPDVLEQVRRIIDGQNGIRACWRTGSGADRTRRVMFAMDSEQHARALQPRLEKWLKDQDIISQLTFISKPAGGAPRVTFDILDPHHVTRILEKPPVFDRRTYYATQSRFVPPVYGLEVAVAGCSEFQGIEGRINAYIRRRYGLDAIAFSRMVLDGEVYTVLFKDWPTTSRFLSDPFEFMSDSSIPRFIMISQPILLYLLNSAGVPANPAFLQCSVPTATADSRNLQAQIDILRQQGVETVHTFSEVLTQQRSAIEQMRSNNMHVMSSVSSLANSVSLSSQLTSSEITLGQLQDRRERLEDSLLLAPNPELRHKIETRLTDLHDEIHDQRHRVDDVRQSLQALTMNAHSSLQLPAPPTDAPPHPSASTITHPRPEPDPDDEARYHARQRTADHTPEQVDMETELISLACLSPPSAEPLNKPLPFCPSERLMQVSGGSCMRESRERRGFLLLLCIHPASRPLSSSSPHPSPRSPFSFFAPSSFLLLLFLLSLFLPTVHATHTFTTYAINANGLANVSKMAAITNAISVRQPHAWVINETKSSQPQASRLHTPSYRTFEEPGIPAKDQRHGKWGVIVGVKRSIHVQRVPTPNELRGRAVILDIVIPTSTGCGFPYRLIGLYAPWDPGEDEQQLTLFWSTITNVCREARFSWCILGDCNASLSVTETSSATPSLSPSRLHYTAFLHNTHALDFWLLRGDADVRSMYTFRNHFGQSIIDRVAHSQQGLLAGTIAIDDIFIPATDHRAIFADITLAPPVTLPASVVFPELSTSHSYPPRFYYPRRHEKHRFESFAASVDALTEAEHLAQFPVSDDVSFQFRYDALTRILHAAATDSFELPHISPPPHPLRTPSIGLIVTELRRINRLIFAERHQTVPLLSLRAPWVNSYIQAFLDSRSPHSFLTFLIHTRRALNKLRYREEHTERQRRATRTATTQMNSVLLGGSCKRLYRSSHDFTDPPLAIASDDLPDAYITAPEDIKAHTCAYFSSLFSRQQRPPMDKPWLNTPSVLEI
ncbi:hypothetical protein SCP_0406180 [Sparassis crispa]|uniref:Endonuclease/exonuclease/phosphatase domain-containing protein n=1 Tax=Sparassis crispa TaxID=139825 RepID=A0A401GJA0_9APHY|nr:hypothetical protein SCP_0406180 [Sparassis crispa]GBE82235.1 hypothetical protein SCP_0406180 [Sparassis crispa]